MSDQTEHQSNRLIHESSPYLQQHAHNPVDWYPWGDEALRRAREEDKPILLSVGYSACHWCHVMAHESFEDPDTAAVMNELFINIKVDREERPDLDRIYQHAHQLLVQRPGGWPLTMFLTPDQVPFVGGTYFPREQRHGLPAFTDILQRISAFYRDHREAIEEQNSSVLSLLASDGGGRAPAQLDTTPITSLQEQLAELFDQNFGGFGSAPKFPQAASLGFLLEREARGGEHSDQALKMALFTLQRMASGGLFDQLGGGFYRYSVDESWTIPHFEKMLYDNGPLMELYLGAWQLTGDTHYHRIVEQSAEWVMREMQSPEGGYYSSQDADSEGEEGRYYLWTPEEIRSSLEPEQQKLALRHFGLDGPANFEGRWHLVSAVDSARLAQEFSLPEGEIRERLAAIRDRLLTLRRFRTAPGTDTKVLVSWNALMIRSMALAGHRLVRPDYTRSAERALDFIRQRMVDDGRLLAVYKDGQARYSAYLDDYAFLLDAVLALLEARWRDGDLNFAQSLADTLLEHYEDESQGGFFFTADDHEALIQRPKPFMDESMPSGNGIAARALLRLGHLTGNLNYVDAARKALAAAWPMMQEYPNAHASMIRALEEELQPPRTVILRGHRKALRPWVAAVNSGFRPDQIVLAIPPEAQSLPEHLAAQEAGEKPLAYICEQHHCSPPISDLSELA